jgi:hypothetical protein
MNLDSLPKATREFMLPYLAEAWDEGYRALPDLYHWRIENDDEPGVLKEPKNPYKEGNR